MSSWKPLRKLSSGKDGWLSEHHSELGCRSTCVILSKDSWEDWEGQLARFQPQRRAELLTWGLMTPAPVSVPLVIWEEWLEFSPRRLLKTDQHRTTDPVSSFHALATAALLPSPNFCYWHHLADLETEAMWCDLAASRDWHLEPA